jgi:hypothetical protein
MKIQTIRVSSSGDSKLQASDVVRLKISGPIDPNDAVMQRARELVVGTGSEAMIESFDRAVQQGAFVSEE